MSSTPAPDGDFVLAKGDNENHNQATETTQVSAGDYDPSMDRREDEQRRFHADDVQIEEEEVEVEEVEEEDDVDDMFAAVTSAKPKVKRMVKKIVRLHLTLSSHILTLCDFRNLLFRPS